MKSVFTSGWFIAVACLLLACRIFVSTCIGAAEGYQHVRFPRYDDKTGLLSSEVESDQADALEVNNDATKIAMRGVTIRVYLLPRTGDPLPKPGEPLPEKIIITSKRGRYERLGSGRTAREDIAYLEGNVHVIRYRYLPDGKRIIGTEIFCDNAAWNQRQEILNSTGPVTIKQPGSRLKGRNLYYKMKQYTGSEKTPVAAAPGIIRADGDKARYGGEVVIRGPVRMVTAKALQPDADKASKAGVGRPGSNGNADSGVKPRVTGTAPQPTIVTCSGVAIYNLDRSMVQFQETVKVDRSNMNITSDFLRVMMHQDKQEIREMIAWGKVRITGKPDQPRGKNSQNYVARGDYARYTVNPEQLFLRDSHKGRNPDVCFGNDRLSDKELLFDTRGGELLKLTTRGGLGEALLHRVERSLGRTQPCSKVQQDLPTRIWYKGGAIYEANRDRAMFSKKVHLTQRELTLDTDELTVEFEPRTQAVPDQARSVRKLLAKGHVVIRQTGCDAVASRAELIREKNLVILFGPPHPQLEKPGVYRLIAPHIEIMQVSVDANQRRRGLITGSGGPGSFVFLPRKKKQAGTDGDIAVSSQAIRVRYDDSMRYNQGVLPLRVVFHKNVVADTDAYVLRSDDLEVVLVEKEVKTGRSSSRRQTQVQRIIATGNATLHSGVRHFKGYRIVRDVPQSVVTLYGRESGKTDASSRRAEVWEENGIHFQAPRIIAMENRMAGGTVGNTIHAEGPGEIVLPDGNKGEKAIVKYDGDADYREFPNQTGKAVFRRNVVMVRQATGMVVRGDVMEAFLEEDKLKDASRPDPATAKHLPRRLRRVVMRGNVMVIQGSRTASGTTGDMIIREAGDIITMTGSQRKNAQVVDQAGMRLYAPQLTVMQSTGIVTADGPGKVYVTSTEPLKHVNARIASRAGSREVNYVILYEDEVKYNSLARKIKFRKNVRLKHQDLQARCERLVLLLEDAPIADKTGRSEPALQVKSAEAFERVRFRRFEPARFKSEERLSPIDRVGKTVYTRSNRAFYDLKTGIVKLFGSPPDPEAIQQTNTVDDEGRLKRSRVKAKASKYILLNVDTGNIKCFPRARVEYLRNTGPLEEDW